MYRPVQFPRTAGSESAVPLQNSALFATLRRMFMTATFDVAMSGRDRLKGESRFVAYQGTVWPR
jgi:hypothetical protein